MVNKNKDDIKIAVGKLHRPHGIHGELKFQPYFDSEAIEPLVGTSIVLLDENNQRQFELSLTSIRPAGKRMAVKFEGVDTPESAKDYTNMIAHTNRSSLPELPEGQYYYEEIIGLPVFDTRGARLGALEDFFSAGEKDVWSIRADNGEEILTPCIPEVIKDVDLNGGRIVVELMEEAE